MFRGFLICIEDWVVEFFKQMDRMMSLDHWAMESTEGQQNYINSLKGMFKGQDSRVECRSLGQRGEKVLTRVRETLRILRPGLKRGTKVNKKKRIIKNPLL